MKIIRLYTGDDGESHFQDMEINMEESPMGKISEPWKTGDMHFFETLSSYGFHPAPKRQFVIFLDGGVEIITGDGTSRVINKGEVLLAEDITGRGHALRTLDEKPRTSIFITLK